MGGDPKDKKSFIVRPINVNATLRRDEWKFLDEALLTASRYRLGGIQDLIDNQCVYTLGNAMGTTVLEWHDSGDFGEAEVTMDGVTRSKGDRPNYQTNYLPIPITHFDYEINARALEASRRLGNPLDTTDVEMAVRKVMEKLENMLFTDTTYNYGEKDDRGNNTIYSYLNFPDRNSVNLSIPWDQSSIGPAGILQDVMEMKAASIAQNHYGPWILYIPTEYESYVEDDYTTTVAGTTLTIKERILKLEGIKAVKVNDTLPANNVVLVEMKQETVRLIDGMGLKNVEWETEGGMVHKYKVMTIRVPQIRSDQNGKCGLVHLA